MAILDFLAFTGSRWCTARQDAGCWKEKLHFKTVFKGFKSESFWFNFSEHCPDFQIQIQMWLRIIGI